MATLRAIASKSILLALAAGTWWIADKLTIGEDSSSKTDNSPVDYYSKNIKRTVLSAQGAVKEKLFAELMTHYKNDDRTELERPVQTLYKSNGEPWVISAESGVSLSGGTSVLLNGKVLITRKDSKGEELRIITSNVKYLPDKEYAETADHVTMLGSKDATTSSGAQVYFEPVLKIKLLADVRRKHETNE